ncbi:MAG: DnaJ C-terminal domain-containing protein [Amaricoccus sp.]
MTDPYETLGLKKTATDKEIRDAFKKLTRKHHPDLHPGDKAAEERFKGITAAHDLLGDPEKRRRFDAGEIDATGAETPQPRYYRDFADNPAWSSHASQEGFASNEDLEEFLSRAFAGGAGGGRQGGRARWTSGDFDFKARGQDASYSLPVAFLDAVNGAARAITLPDGKQLKVRIPEGAVDRQMLRLKGQGGPGYGGGEPGDAYVELHVEPHAFFHRKDDDIHLDLPVTLKEAVLGGRVEVPTISGPVSLTVPAGSNTGKVMRLRDKGVLDPKSGRRGHQFVTLKVVLPTGDEPELAAFLEGWTPRSVQNPRKEMLP